MLEQYVRGSKWRRWELHLHTPFTKKNDCYTGNTSEEKWDSFYSAIGNYIGDGNDPIKAVCAIAITDYLSIDNYLKVKADNRLPPCVKLLLPNIEMRMLPVAQANPINIHCIFSPDIDIDIETRFLSKLKDAAGHTAAKAELIRLGREHMNDCTLNEMVAYKTGIEQFVVTSEAIKSIFKDDPDLRNKVIIAVSNKSGDGVSGIVSHSDFFTENGCSQLDATRQGIYKMSDMIFSSTLKDRNYFIGKGPDSPEEVKRKCGSLKPCVHGCDAHCYDRLLAPAEDRYCWIKADPTFEGLKQILYEPKDRVFIGNNIPDEKPGYYVIDHVNIEGNTYFSSDPTFFSDKLTCIIGGKSTGKSLLLHSTAYTIDAKQVDLKTETATTKVRPIREMRVYWRDGHVTSLNDSEDKKRKIVYIPQTYLNRLSDDKENTTEIDNIIQDIVLQNADANRAFVKQNKDINAYKQQLYKNIVELISCDTRMKELIRDKMAVGDETGIRSEILRLKGELDKLSASSGITETDISAYQDSIEKLKSANERIGLINTEKRYIESIGTVIKPIEFYPDITLYSPRLKQAITTITIFADEKWAVEREKIIQLISTEITELGALYSSKQDIIDRLKPQMESHAQIDHLTKTIEVENAKIREIDKINEQILAVHEKFNLLLEDISCSLEYFRKQHATFADAVNSNQSISSQGLEFRVDVIFKTQEYIEKINSLLNNRSFTHFSLFTNSESISEQKLTIPILKELILSLLSNDNNTLKVKGNNTIESVLRELFSDFYNINYVVKMEDDVIYDMSPGKKALVLLRLLISLAESRCPILIDQPEDDLDNRSIFDELIEFIKEKKSVRQIIIVTHNANVVLGGDAELVIVANQHGKDSPQKEFRFEYRSGSIENNLPQYKEDGTIENGILNQCGIQTHICEILEGGERAFDLRRNKYRFIK